MGYLIMLRNLIKLVSYFLIYETNFEENPSFDVGIS